MKKLGGTCRVIIAVAFISIVLAVAAKLSPVPTILDSLGIFPVSMLRFANSLLLLSIAIATLSIAKEE